MAMWGRLARDSLLPARETPGSAGENAIDQLATMDESDVLSKDDFHKLLAKIDSGLRALPATAQVCVGQTTFLRWIHVMHGMISS